MLGLLWACLVALKAILFLQLYGVAHRMYTRGKLDEQVPSRFSVSSAVELSVDSVCAWHA
jgi:hypothetical protein